jgi:hypothetical protein
MGKRGHAFCVQVENDEEGRLGLVSEPVRARAGEKEVGRVKRARAGPPVGRGKRERDGPVEREAWLDGLGFSVFISKILFFYFSNCFENQIEIIPE